MITVTPRRIRVTDGVCPSLVAEYQLGFNPRRVPGDLTLD